MRFIDLIDETICAQITPQGQSGIAVIRLSGAKSLAITQKLCSFLPSQPESHRVYYGFLKDSNGQNIDEVLVTYFARGRSFTGDESIEISCHGGFSSSHRILSELASLGARPAERGEFTFRAFYNGKMDLVQAEGVLSIIQSQTEKSREVAIEQIRGKLSGKIATIEDDLILILAQLEASIDFSTEDIEPYSLDQMMGLIQKTRNSIQGLVDSYKSGKILKEGVRVLIAGPTNAGKSSLYNYLVGEHKAIVTDIAGTTRDILETSIILDGIQVRLTDSAGIRETSDVVEKMGISKSLQAIQESDLIIYLLDSQNPDHDYSSILDNLDKTIFVANKMDLAEHSADTQKKVREILFRKAGYSKEKTIHFVSVNKDMKIQPLIDEIKKVCLSSHHQNDNLITQFRHFDHLSKALKTMDSALIQVKKQGSYDLIAQDIQMSLKEVLTLLGKELDEQVLDKVFSQFCLGK